MHTESLLAPLFAISIFTPIALAALAVLALLIRAAVRPCPIAALAAAAVADAEWSAMVADESAAAMIDGLADLVCAERERAAVASAMIDGLAAAVAADETAEFDRIHAASLRALAISSARIDAAIGHADRARFALAARVLIRSGSAVIDRPFALAA